jgi:hypothetical protein
LISVQDMHPQGPGQSALQLAASDDCRKVLKRAGAHGWTALHVAAEEGDIESLKSLLSDGARVRLDELNGVKAIRALPHPSLNRDGAQSGGDDRYTLIALSLRT